MVLPRSGQATNTAANMPVYDTQPIFIWTIVGFALATMFTLLRVYVRAFVTKSLGGDDWTLISAALTFTAFTGLQLTYAMLAMGHGYVDHQERVTLVCSKA
ncbi:hypothetical protein ANO11243_049610 [Dothideomycetidae sp. 11243]|nr:hypothetical protein ANO11243_049610 [fungal sp. No.11243]